MKSICNKFWNESFIDPFEKTDQQNGMPAPTGELSFDAVNLIDLPDPRNLKFNSFNLTDFIENRRTIRKYTDKSLPIMELSFLLWATQGLIKNMPDERSLRTVPSAGARHAFETILLINNIEGIKSGLYRYIVSKHKLLSLDFSKEKIEDLISGFRNINLVANSAVTFLWIAVPERMTWKFNARGYRYLLLDAGHICQNLYLAAEAIDCGCCAIGAFDDEEINAILQLNNSGQFLAYAASIGKK
ncbi:MAG: nitroreductase [Chlamydiae bacterium]|nr:MAG: nitroreductase [Chlamydiota bacterium]